jgi:hypothetical protein
LKIIMHLFSGLQVFCHRSRCSAAFLLGLSLTLACAGDAAKPESGGLPDEQIAEIRERIGTLHARQADYLRKVAAGEVKPDDDLRKQWPQIQQQAGELRGMIVSLNSLSEDSGERPSLEGKLLGSLQHIGIHLESASHPAFAPRVLDAADIAEMERIEKAIAGMKFGDRASAKPVKLLDPAPSFTLIHLPVPIVLQCRPGDSVFLASTTGGAFHNGLSLIELKADKEGIAKTTWTSIGDAVGDCDITIYSQAAIETQQLRIKVVNPALPNLDGLPQPEHLKGEIPRLKSKLTTLKGRASQLAE